MTDLQPTRLAFGRLKIWFLLTFGCKSTHTCEPLSTRESIVTCVIFALRC